MRKLIELSFSCIVIIFFIVLVGCQGKSEKKATSPSHFEENKNSLRIPTTPLPTDVIESKNDSSESLEPIQLETNVSIAGLEEEQNLSEPHNFDEIEISSPLQGISIEELSEIESNAFDFAGNGKDEGHHGTDFSFYRYKSFEKIENLPIQSIFSGTIRSLINNRPPYGNMIIVETPLGNFPLDMQQFFYEVYSAQIPPFHTNLNCPDYQIQEFEQNLENLSVYVLYAHLNELPEKIIGQHIASGEIIGEVGNSGMSGNPHLHLEMRVGMSNYDFEMMAHYDNAASLEEIYNYCLWRVSGYFFQYNPMDFFMLYLQNR